MALERMNDLMLTNNSPPDVELIPFDYKNINSDYSYFINNNLPPIMELQPYIFNPAAVPSIHTIVSY